MNIFTFISVALLSLQPHTPVSSAKIEVKAAAQDAMSGFVCGPWEVMANGSKVQRCEVKGGK